MPWKQASKSDVPYQPGTARSPSKFARYGAWRNARSIRANTWRPYDMLSEGRLQDEGFVGRILGRSATRGGGFQVQGERRSRAPEAASVSR